MTTRVGRFFMAQHTKTGKIYQMDKNRPNCQKIYQIAIKFTKHFPFQGPPKYTQIEILVRKSTVWQPWRQLSSPLSNSALSTNRCRFFSDGSFVRNVLPKSDQVGRVPMQMKTYDFWYLPFLECKWEAAASRLFCIFDAVWGWPLK
jgi:hypothetical protein